MNDESQIRDRAGLAADSFRRMAARVELNGTDNFAGAFVIFPSDGDPVELLLLNNQQDKAMFWGLLKTTSEIALAELAEQQAAQWGGMSRR